MKDALLDSDRLARTPSRGCRLILLCGVFISTGLGGGVLWATSDTSAPDPSALGCQAAVSPEEDLVPACRRISHQTEMHTWEPKRSAAALDDPELRRELLNVLSLLETNRRFSAKPAKSTFDGGQALSTLAKLARKRGDAALADRCAVGALRVRFARVASATIDEGFSFPFKTLTWLVDRRSGSKLRERALLLRSLPHPDLNPSALAAGARYAGFVALQRDFERHSTWALRSQPENRIWGYVPAYHRQPNRALHSYLSLSRELTGEPPINLEPRPAESDSESLPTLRMNAYGEALARARVREAHEVFRQAIIALRLVRLGELRLWLWAYEAELGRPALSTAELAPAIVEVLPEDPLTGRPFLIDDPAALDWLRSEEMFAAALAAGSGPLPDAPWPPALEPPP